MSTIEAHELKVLGDAVARCPSLQKSLTEQEMRRAVSLLVFAALCAGAAAHIHSQKVHHIERDKVSVKTWLLALCSSLLVAACGVFPVLLNRWVHLDEHHKQSLPLRAVLSFAVGGLLGDVFLHLLPEAWGAPSGAQADWGTGFWVLVGIMSFLVVEKVASCTEKAAEPEQSPGSGDAPLCHPPATGRPSSDGAPRTVANGWSGANGVGKPRAAQSIVVHRNGHISTPPSPPSPPAEAAAPVHHSSQWWGKDVSGYLNLVANCTDNFTHGLAIAASYVASPTVGVLTTLAILCHEVPHEIGDFAILLKSGFSMWAAAKAQLVTACGGVVGVVVGLTAEHLSNSTSWLLPFTAGGFLYISMVSILPELLEDTSWRHTVLQLLLLLVGVVVMAAVTIVEKKSCGYMPHHLLTAS